MAKTFYSDNGKPCYRCEGTIFEYTVDDAVSLIDTLCVSCTARDIFSTSAKPETVKEVSEAHRAS